MTETKHILCLALSGRTGGYCVAGKILADGKVGEWIRPVASNTNRAIEERYVRGYSNARIGLELLDIIGLPLKARVPVGHHVENWAIEPDKFWELHGCLAKEDFKGHYAGYIDSPATLWGTGFSSQRGLNDGVSQSLNIANSLYMIYVDSVTLTVTEESYRGRDRKRLQARFCYKSVDYCLSVTDSQFHKHCQSKPQGDYKIGASCLTISLAEEAVSGYYYKLVAGIIRL